MSVPFSLLERCRALETNWNNVGASGENLLTLVEAIYKGKQEGALEYDEDDLLAGLCDLFLSWPLQAASVTVSELATHMKRGLQLLYTAYGVEGVTPVATTLTDTKITSLYATWENLGPYGDALRTLCYAINEGADEEDQVTYTPADMAEALGGMAATMVLNPMSLSFEDFVLIAQTGIDALIEDAGGEGPVAPSPTEIGDQASQPTVPDFVQPGTPIFGQTQVPLVVTPTSPYAFDVEGTQVLAGGPYTYILTNRGTLPAAWEVTGVPAWLQMSTTSGSIEGKSALTVSMGLFPAGVIALATGVYTATLVFRDITTNTTNVRLVTLDWTVPAVDPVLSFSPFANFDVEGHQGDPGSFSPTTKAFVVSNIGQVAGDWSVALSPSWLTVAPVSPTSGTLQPGASAIVRLTYDADEAADLEVGVLTGSITWTNEDTEDEAVLSFNVNVKEPVDDEGVISQPVGNVVGIGNGGAIPDPIVFTPPGPLPEEEEIIKAGPFYDIYGQMTTRPYGRIELDLDQFDGPDCRVIEITWVSSTGKYAVKVDGTTIHNGTSFVSTSLYPTEPAFFEAHQTTPRIIGYCYRTFRKGATFCRIDLNWVSGNPTYPTLGIGSTNPSYLGGDGPARCIYETNGSPVKNLLITAKNLEGARIKINRMSGGTSNGGYDGVVLRHIEFGPDNDSIAAYQGGLVSNNFQNYNGFLAILGCYFKPAPYGDYGLTPKLNFRDQFWAIRMYTPGGLLVRDCVFGNTSEMRLFGEHCLYLSNPREFVFVENNTACVTSRTFIQVTNRQPSPEGDPAGPNGGSSYGPVVVTGNTHDGVFWPTIHNGVSGGGSFTIAGHLGPAYFDNNTITGTIPTLTPHTWISRGAGYVFWAGGSHSPTANPTTQDGGIPWNVIQQGDSVFLDELGFANSLVWVGKTDFDITVPGSGGWTGSHVLTTQSVRDFFLYVGADQVLDATATPTFRLDFMEEGVGNADQVPHIAWDGSIRIIAVESEKIRLFDTYDPEVTAPSITSVEATAVFDDLVEGWTARRPCGGVLKGTTITELDWSFDSTEYAPLTPAVNIGAANEYTPFRFFLAANLMADQWRECFKANNQFSTGVAPTFTLTPNLAPASLTSTQAARLFFHDKNPSAAPYPFQGQTWILTWDGDPDAVFSFDGNVTGGTLQTNGRRLGTTLAPNRVSINVGTSNTALSIVLEGPFVGGGEDAISNLRFFPLSQEAVIETTIFVPELLKHLEGVECIRFMDTLGTNDSEIVGPSDRRPVTACYQGGLEGMSLEYVIALCNALEADLWYCAPHQGNDALFEADAALIAGTLDAPLKCYVELSNELWNIVTFDQGTYALEQANLEGLTGTNTEKIIKWQALRSSELFAIFEDEFGGLSRLVRVGALQNTGAFPVETFLDFEHDAVTPATLADITDLVTIAPYFGSNVAGDEYYEQSINWTEAQIANHLRWRVANGVNSSGTVDTTAFWTNPTAAQAAATSRGVAFGGYEGGQSLVANGQAFASTGPNAAANAAFWARMANVNRSEAMGEIYTAYLRCLKYRGYAPFALYKGDVGAFGQYGSWSHGEYYGHDLPKEVAYRVETGLPGV